MLRTQETREGDLSLGVMIMTHRTIDQVIAFLNKEPCAVRTAP